MKKTIFKNATVLGEDFSSAKTQNVVVEGQKIIYVGSDMPYAGEVIDCSGKILTPAFYNAHTHLSMSPMRGYGENTSLSDWLFTKIFPYEAELKKQGLFYATQLSLAEMIRYGTVSATDMYFNLDEVFDAVEASGCKANISNGMTSFDVEDYKSLGEYKEIDRLVDRARRSDGKIIFDIGIHAEYTNNEKAIRAAAEEAAKRGLSIQVHLSETKKEVEECKARHGKTPVEFLSDCKVFDVPTTAAHCVWLEENDFDILAEKGVSAACCPKSNLKLASGISDAVKMKRKGINVCLGTDSVASNNNLNIFEELRTFALVQKVKNLDPIALSPSDVLKIATRNGAVAQGRKDCGLIKEGFKADLIVVDRAPWLAPCHDISADLVYSVSGDSVYLTMCDGKILYQNGVFTTIDVEKAAREVEIINEKILARIGKK